MPRIGPHGLLFPLSPASGSSTSLLSIGLKFFDTTRSRSKGGSCDLILLRQGRGSQNSNGRYRIFQVFRCSFSFFLLFSPVCQKAVCEQVAIYSTGKQGFQAVLRLISVFFTETGKLRESVKVRINWAVHSESPWRVLGRALD